MKRLLVVVLCFLMPITIWAGDSGYKVTYDGGSIPDTKPGTGMKLIIEAGQADQGQNGSDYHSSLNCH